ncbi:MAG: D-2-hydroxyacid dehydrogenase [Treponema sp.]|nr:D-2-hydroxyacid dehydrogenase [Treponema sp.]
MKIVILDGYAENPGDLSWDPFKNLGELTVYDRTPAEKIVERIGNAGAVITNKTPITKETLAKCPDIVYIGVLATGYNIVDAEAARARSIAVTNVPTYATDATGQFAIALLLEICHHIGHHSMAVKEGRWENSIDFCFWDYPLIELAGKTMGIIGFGRIGQTVGRTAKALGMKIIAHDEQQTETGKVIATYVPLEELLERSDVISLHCPLLPSTKGIINRNTIAKMKDGVIIINNSRGPVIAEADLAEALNSGKVFAAAVDVVSEEPIRRDNPLLKAKNCIITPHISWAPSESRRRLMNVAADNLKAFIGGHPVNVVN